MSSSFPQNFGRYTLVRRLGEGGMAEVFLANVRVAEGLAKWVVIKKIRRDFADQLEFRGMFVEEAKIALSLNHANIVHVFDFGQIDSALYLAMELVEGVDLMHFVHSVRADIQAFPAVFAAYIVHQIASGVGYVHRKSDDHGKPLGIVHRDITPHNVMISYDGQVKLLDFGIARTGQTLAHTQGEDDASWESIKGKVAYMSPEQACGRAIDQRSDIYSMGVILYELLTGEALFRDSDRKEALRRVRSEAIPPLAERAPDLPRELLEIVDSALQRDRNQRTSTARELQSQLAAFLHRSDPVVDDDALSEFLTRYHPRVASTLAVPSKRDPDQATHASLSSVRLSYRSVRAVLLSASFVRDPKSIGSQQPVQDLSPLLTFLRDFAFKREADVVELDARGLTWAFGVLPTAQDPADRALRTAQSLRERIGELEEGLGLGMTMMSTTVQVHRERNNSMRVILPEGLSHRLRRHARRFVDDRIMVTRELVERLRRSWRFGGLSPIHAALGGDAGFSPWEADFQESAPFLGPLSEAERRAHLQQTGAQALLGRELELKVLRDALTDVIRGASANTVLVHGGPGIGKRALLEGFLSSIPAGSCAVLRGAGLWTHRNQPLTLILDILRRFLHVDAHTPATEFVARLRDYKVQDASKLGATVAAALGLPGAALDSTGAAEQREQSMRLMRSLIRSLAARRPVLLLVENLQYIDAQSLEMLEAFVQHPAKLPILCILSGRTTPRIESAIEGSQTVRIELSELDEQARRQMVLRRFAAPEDASRLVDAILAQTGGHPLFIEETLASLLRRNVIGWAPNGRQWVVLDHNAPIEVPPSMESMLQDRIDALDDVAREVLQTAAILGRRFRVREIPALAQSLDPSAIENALQRLLADDMLREETAPSPAGGKRMRIATIVLHDVARASVPSSRLPHLHSFAARAKRMRLDYLRGRDDGPIAEHLWHAGQHEESIEPALRAARHAREISGSLEAYHHLSQALKALKSDDPRRFQALLDRELILRVWGKKRARGADLRKVVDFAKTFGNEEHRALATIRLLGFYIDCGWYGRGERLIPDIESRLPHIANPAPYRAQLAELKSSLQFFRREFAKARQTAQAGLEHCAHDLSGQRQRGRLLTRLGEAELGNGQFESARVTFQSCLRLARSIQHRRLEAEALNHLGSAAGLMTHYQEAVECFSLALEIDRELGDRHHTGTKLANLGITYTAIGLYQRAELFLRKALEFHEAMGHPGQLHNVMISLGDAALGLGAPERARSMYQEAERIASQMDDPRKVLRAIARTALAMVCDQASPEELLEAKTLAEKVVHDGDARGFSTAVARGLRILAQLAELEGDLAQAIALERRAVELVREGAAPLEGVFSIYHLGRRLVMTSETEQEGHELLREAAKIVAQRLSTLQDPELRAGYTRQPAVMKILEDGGQERYIDPR